MGFFEFEADAEIELPRDGGDATGPAREASLRRRLEVAGIPADDLEIKVVGTDVFVRGKIEDQEAYEKLILLIGNSAGVARVDADNVQVFNGGDPPAAAPPLFHTVVAGETLTGIAADYNCSPETLLEANQPMVGSADELRPGLVIRVPGPR